MKELARDMKCGYFSFAVLMIYFPRGNCDARFPKLDNISPLWTSLENPIEMLTQQKKDFNFPEIIKMTPAAIASDTARHDVIGTTGSEFLPETQLIVIPPIKHALRLLGKVVSHVRERKNLALRSMQHRLRQRVAMWVAGKVQDKMAEMMSKIGEDLERRRRDPDDSIRKFTDASKRDVASRESNADKPATNSPRFKMWTKMFTSDGRSESSYREGDSLKNLFGGNPLGKKLFGERPFGKNPFAKEDAQPTRKHFGDKEMEKSKKKSEKIVETEVVGKRTVKGKDGKTEIIEEYAPVSDDERT